MKHPKVEASLKSIVLSGRRLFMKWKNIEYFEERAKEANAAIVTVRSDDESDFRAAAKDASAIVVIARKVSRQTIQDLGRCELILALSVGYDCVDVSAATERGIPVSNVPAYCTDDVANHSMALLTAVARKLTLLNNETKQARWDYNIAKPIYTFRRRCLGIIGLGKIGRAIVPKARGFGMEVLAYDPYVHDDIFQLLGVKRKYELDDLFRESDYISIHAPLTPETFHLIDNRAFGLMKKHVVIVNTSRGNIIDEKALYESLKNRRVAGAGIDVLGTEPPEEDFALLKLDNVLVTPHIAWYSEESLERARIHGMDEVVNVLNGKRPRYIVNPEVFGHGNTH
jgi:D-3-phosphoglycerate dehydrogenase